MNQKKGKIFVVSGPSGAGKGTLIRILLKRVPELNYSVSVTTRKKREGEVEGKDYFFVSEEKFREMMNDGELLEWAYVHNHWYGTPKRWVEKLISRGKDVLLELDVQGAVRVKEIFPDCILIFIKPPSKISLIDRLKRRSTESEQEVKVRLETAERELGMEEVYDYCIVNDDVDAASRELVKIVQKERGVPV